jgi:hypothetical protein
MTNIEIPTVEDALDYLVDMLRETGSPAKNFGYDLWISRVTDRYARSAVLPPGSPPLPLFGGPASTGPLQWESVSQEVSPPFMDAAWQLCRLGVLRPSPRDFRQQSSGEGEGFSITSFGHTWLKEHESPAYVPTDPSRMMDLLTRRQDLFGQVYVQRASDAARCYSAHAYYACCAMIGAAAESILLAAGIAKLGEDPALKKYLSHSGRKALTEAVLAGCADYIAKEFRLHTDLIALWRDQSAHAQSAPIGETVAFTNFRGLIKFAQLAESRWEQLTGVKP